MIPVSPDAATGVTLRIISAAHQQAHQLPGDKTVRPVEGRRRRDRRFGYFTKLRASYRQGQYPMVGTPEAPRRATLTITTLT